MPRADSGAAPAERPANAGSNERIPLNAATAAKDFRDFYWLKSELQAFCRSHGLSASGGKMEIADRIDLFLRSGLRKAPKRAEAPAGRSASRGQSGPLSFLSRAPAGFKCSQEARRFFEVNVSPHFRFTVTLQNHIKAHPGITFAGIARQWRREQKARKEGSFKPDIAPQFEFNRFTRDYHADPKNAAKTRADCLEAWKRTRSRRGDNLYKPD